MLAGGPVRLLLLTLTIVLQSCAGTTAGVAIPSVATDGCPFILLTRSGGLGYEWQSGVIAAAWHSGQIVRAESVDRPWQAHVIGQLASADVADLMARVNSSDVWDAPPGRVALDFPSHTLSTPIVAEFRAKLVSLSIERATRVRQSLEDLNKCLH